MIQFFTAPGFLLDEKILLSFTDFLGGGGGGGGEDIGIRKCRTGVIKCKSDNVNICIVVILQSMHTICLQNTKHLGFITPCNFRVS